MKKYKKIRVILKGILIFFLVAVLCFFIYERVWNSMDTVDKLNRVTNKSIDNKKVFGSMVKIQSKDGILEYEKAQGNLSIDDKFSIASVTKMFTATIIYQLADEERLQLTDTLEKYFTSEELDGLHIYEDNEYAQNITIEELLSHTSGLPDYYTEKIDEATYFDEIVEKDQTIEFNELLAKTKQLDAHFVNGTDGKAFYADINFDILGVIAERITSKTLEELYKEGIFKPLRLENTNLASKDSEFTPIYVNKKKLDRPLAISSFRASGGIISNLDDMIVFLKAFNEGELFSNSHINISKWNKIQWFPIQYKNGMMRVKMSRLLSPFIPAPEIIGHSGSTGSFAFYCPTKEIYMVGTINQVNKTPYSFIYKLLNCINE